MIIKPPDSTSRKCLVTIDPSAVRVRIVVVVIVAVQAHVLELFDLRQALAQMGELVATTATFPVLAKLVVAIVVQVELAGSPVPVFLKKSTPSSTRVPGP